MCYRSVQGIKEVREIVEGCFNNLHPAYILKKLVVKRELEGDKEKINEDWGSISTYSKK